MKGTRLVRLLLAAILASALMGLLSFLVNELLLGGEHARHTIFRPDSDPHRTPGLAITSLGWGLLLALGYRRFGSAAGGRPGAARGARFGGLVFGLFVAVHEIFYYQFLQMSVLLLLGGLVHYLLSYAGAGALVGLVLDRERTGAQEFMARGDKGGHADRGALD